MTRSAPFVALVVLVSAAGCGAGDDRQTVAGDSASPSDRYRTRGTVLASPDHGPQLCRIVAQSYPPQCGGPDLVGWDWTEVDGEESVLGTTWGDYEVTGTWDGERLTLTAPPASATSLPTEEPDVSTPCPEPDGGWAVVDPATTSDASLTAVTDAARTRPDFAGLWWDQPISGSVATNDPTDLVVNVRVSGEVDAAERDLREIWGGALCVTAADRSQAELAAIQSEIDETAEAIGMVSSTVDDVTGVVEVEVVVDDAALQEEYDARHGPGTVVVTAWLEPVD
jgi:hypothetical protein